MASRIAVGHPSGAPSLTYLTLPLPDGVGLQSPPTVSPDGSSIAFVGSDAKGRRLFVRRLDSPEFRAIPGTEFAADHSGRLTGSGSRFCPRQTEEGRCRPRDARGHLQRIRGSRRQLGPGWQHRLYAHLIDSPVYRVSANGGVPEPVTRLDESRGDNSHRWPVFLPDGVHFLCFVRSFEDGRRGIYVGRADRPAEAPGARLIESEHAASYVPFESDSVGAVLTVVPDGVPDPPLRRQHAHARRASSIDQCSSRRRHTRCLR